MEPDKNNTNSVNPNVLGAQVEIQPAAQPNTPEVSDAHTQVLACPTTQSVPKSHHKKKIPIKCGPQPLTVPQCLDTFSDQKYIPSAPYPSDDWVDNWEAPLDKRPRSQKRKAPAAKVTKDGSAKPMEKKKASKKPKVTGEWKVSTHEQKTSSIALPILHLSKSHAPPPHANTTPKAHPIASKEAEIKELGVVNSESLVGFQSRASDYLSCNLSSYLTFLLFPFPLRTSFIFLTSLGLSNSFVVLFFCSHNMFLAHISEN